jgi:hypothetical protein
MTQNEIKGQEADDLSTSSTEKPLTDNYFTGSTENLLLAKDVIDNEVKEYSTEGKDYPTLCAESQHFKVLFKVLNELNESIKTADRRRKQAINDSPRPSSVRQNNAFEKRVKDMPQDKLDQLRRKS